MKGATRGLQEEWMEGNLKEMSEVNASAVPRRQNELVGKFMMVPGDMISIMGQVMEYTYIPTGIKREMVGSGVD
jgi:hypothetical protein